MRILLLIICLATSNTAYAFLDSIGLSVLAGAIVDVVTKDRSAWRGSDWIDPVEEVELDEQVSRHCDPYGGCSDYVSTTTVRKVREYRYDWDPQWDQWSFTEYQKY